MGVSRNRARNATAEHALTYLRMYEFPEVS